MEVVLFHIETDAESCKMTRLELNYVKLTVIQVKLRLQDLRVWVFFQPEFFFSPALHLHFLFGFHKLMF